MHDSVVTGMGMGRVAAVPGGDVDNMDSCRWDKRGEVHEIDFLFSRTGDLQLI